MSNMHWEEIPARPDAAPAPAPKKKARVWPWIVGVVIVAAIAAGNGQDETTPTATADPVTTYEVTADDVVDIMGPSQVASFCTLYDQLGDYDVAYRSFAGGYGTTQDPNAQEVFDELLSRC